MDLAIPKNFNDDHYFMFPGALWRSFETGVLDKDLLPVLMRPAVRFVTRAPVAPPNPIPTPFPAIEALIEEHNHDLGLFHELRASYLRQRLRAIAPHRLAPTQPGNA